MVDFEMVRKHVREVDTPAVCDADKKTRVMSEAIRCRSKNPSLCGPAFTVQCRGDLFPVIRALEEAAPGDVVVVDGGGRELALGGEIFARAALARKLAGIIVDGGYRDVSYVNTCDLPVFSRHVTPMAAVANSLGDLQVPVSCGGVVVSPGDVIIADQEGIVVLDPASAIPVLEAAREVKATEAAVINKVNEGATLVDCLNVAEHYDRLAQGSPSTLRFTP
ncbi:hypothetical protein GCM10012275_57330 [Longimycelium tulufanense]|uniref:Putative 4-hydroxy-4-methyl-2-oxoglutarate aldolase n=1 Tax=Longimycelium tulufanense TaxID=907463 RepID=A0A8J3CJY6_9PSEU|nr:hypothetical protein [Longimycelium tulufanense]GGM79266.1 hypothetical protein GCM10012275_57330 [Longimycelium tulufanense]